MSKCPKCDRRKGKRFCPALDQQICSSCCGAYRLQEIACPQDCPFLEGEFYQLHRRESRARSFGKTFLASLERLFYSEAARNFAFMVLADTYWWHRERDQPTDEDLANAYETLASRFSDVVVPGSVHPLVDFFLELIPKSPRYRQHEAGGFETAQRRTVAETLARHFRGARSGRESSQDTPSKSPYWSQVRSYFDELDFEADLDYSPGEELAGEAGLPRNVVGGESGYEERGSGLVVPKD